MQFLVVVSTLAVIAVSSFQCLEARHPAFSIQELAHEEWEAFKVMFGKAYESHIEESFRKKIYLENRRKIAVHNQANKTYRLNMNSFGDLLPHEFLKAHNGLKVPHNRTLLRAGVPTFLPPSHVSVPESVDWREKGYVTPVKDQQQCGSCWAFSSTGSLEGQIFRKTGKLVSLSEQNLVDCSENYDNNGCNGGLPDNPFNNVKSNGGIDTEKSYPYEAVDGRCRYKPKNKAGTDHGFMDVKEGDEEQLKIAVATVGPISVGIDASHESFQFYSEGIYYEESCSSDNIDHAVLLVGYGSENGQDYWLVKNSWNTWWGENGYIRMARNKDNNCGIATLASYPIV